MALLKMCGITKLFDDVPANENVSLEVEYGEIHALLGENGAGKTTLMNVLYGLYQCDEGVVYFEDKQVHFGSPKDAIGVGIGMVHQHFMLVKGLTVLENIVLGLDEGGSAFLNKKKVEAKILEIGNQYGLIVDASKKIEDLSVGEQQKVEILKALYRDVKLLILDEPTAVLTPQETKEFFVILKNLKEKNHSIIIITHRMSEIMEVSDSVTILRDGKNVKTLYTKDTCSRELSVYMIGREIGSDVEKKICAEEKEETLLSLKGVRLKSKKRVLRLKDVELEIKKGEIFGIAGVDGNGQNELAEVIAGIRKLKHGEILFKGENINSKNVLQRAAMGIGYVPDDRHKDGLVLNLDVERNLALRCYRRSPFSKRGIINGQMMKKRTQEAIDAFKIKASGGSVQVRKLSGGNQQKIVLSREIYENPELLIVCQPTRGLDIGATEYIRELLIELRNTGKSIVLISADLEEILGVSDRIGVMFAGKMMEIFVNNASIDVQRIGRVMGGHIKGGAVAHEV